MQKKIIASKRKIIQSEDQTNFMHPQTSSTHASTISVSTKFICLDQDTSQKITISQINQQLSAFNIQERKFNTNWKKLLSLVEDNVKFELLQPIPISQQGAALLQDGLFVALWMRILLTNNFLNKNLIIRNSYQKWKPCIKTNFEEFQQFFSLKLQEPQKQNRKFNDKCLKRVFTCCLQNEVKKQE